MRIFVDIVLVVERKAGESNSIPAKELGDLKPRSSTSKTLPFFEGPSFGYGGH